MCNIVRAVFEECKHEAYQNTGLCPLTTSREVNYISKPIDLLDQQNRVPDAALKCPKKGFPVRPQDGLCPACKECSIVVRLPVLRFVLP
jgi:hypothetical protein